MRAIEAMPGAGIYGVEMFLVAAPDDAGSPSDAPAPRVLLNEIAPRPHNSGHYTQDAAACCQFEQHVRAVIGAPLGPTHMTAGGGSNSNGSGSNGRSGSSSTDAGSVGGDSVFCTMINVLGDGAMESTMRVCARAMRVPGAHVHWCVRARGCSAFPLFSLSPRKMRLRACSVDLPISIFCTVSRSELQVWQGRVQARPQNGSHQCRRRHACAGRASCRLYHWGCGCL